MKKGNVIAIKPKKRHSYPTGEVHNKADHLLKRQFNPSSETDIRDFVKKRKVSGGTRSDEGRKCRDTFISLKKTCQKLGVSFWQYLTDRHGIGEQTIPLLQDMITERASLAPGY
jgi:hypothetical protein